jgi:glutamine amidotransferase
MSHVTLIDHGAGNLRSVVRALETVGATVVVSSDPTVVAASGRVVLPGQGAFADCMDRLRERDLDTVLIRHIASGRPYLGICLGLQVLFERGYEHGLHDGLGVLKGECVAMTPSPGVKIPHMGWNQVACREGAAVGGIESGSWFYFVHSYCVKPAQAYTCGSTTHGESFVSAVEHENILAVQFHPEKSQQSGLELLRRFVS